MKFQGIYQGVGSSELEKHGLTIEKGPRSAGSHKPANNSFFQNGKPIGKEEFDKQVNKILSQRGLEK